MFFVFLAICLILFDIIQFIATTFGPIAVLAVAAVAGITFFLEKVIPEKNEKMHIVIAIIQLATCASTIISLMKYFIG